MLYLWVYKLNAIYYLRSQRLYVHGYIVQNKNDFLWGTEIVSDDEEPSKQIEQKKKIKYVQGTRKSKRINVAKDIMKWIGNVCFAVSYLFLLSI